MLPQSTPGSATAWQLTAYVPSLIVRVHVPVLPQELLPPAFRMSASVIWTRYEPAGIEDTELGIDGGGLGDAGVRQFAGTLGTSVSGCRAAIARIFVSMGPLTLSAASPLSTGATAAWRAASCDGLALTKLTPALHRV